MHSTEVRADGDGARDIGVRAGESERQRFRTKTETSGENAEVRRYRGDTARERRWRQNPAGRRVRVWSQKTAWRSMVRETSLGSP